VTTYIFDTETTDRADGEIIEAAWMQFAPVYDLGGQSDQIDLRTIGEHSFRYKPSKPISFGAMAVHHILPHELEGCPPFTEFALPANTVYIIGHSIEFDWKAAGSPKHVKRICTHAIAQWLWPDASGYSQSALIYMLLGATEQTRDLLRGAHGALTDVRNNHILLQHILALKPEITTWSRLWAYSEQCRIPRTCPLKRWDGVLLEDMDDGAINWCLDQPWLDPYFRKGLENVMQARLPRRAHVDDDYSLEIEEDDDREDDDSRTGPDDMEA